MMVKTLHRMTGIGLLAFIGLHFAVHLFALAGPEAHNAALKLVQGLYRNRLVEPLLVLAVLVQVIAGIRLLVQRWGDPEKSAWARFQLASGAYLAMFMINHTIAALYTRYGAGLDTNFWWVSGPLQQPQLKLFFYPYYALAVMAIGIHAGAALHFGGKARAARIVALAGVPIVIAYWASFGGWLFPVDLPPAYHAYSEWLAGLM